MASDQYTISATVTDDDTGSSSVSSSVTVHNVSPANPTRRSSDLTINENGSTTVSGSFTDVGTQDTHTVVIAWGTGEGTTTLTLGADVLRTSVNSQHMTNN